ncbi:MAG: hypothetical protein HQL49_12650 [Gammaproteobacteria bacterium]|nr:hypothetical protein [Gammaproteobacteria bacterium]
MNIFILNSGRCGSTTFIAACQAIKNFSAAHESRIHLIGEARYAFPPHHIEADNRLSWSLGRLDRHFGNRAYYVHLQRQNESCAASFAKRSHFGIMRAYREGLLLGGAEGLSDHAIALDYLDTIESNIHLFLRDKSHVLPFQLEHASEDFAKFWHWIGATGDYQQAVACWQQRYNASD